MLSDASFNRLHFFKDSKFICDAILLIFPGRFILSAEREGRKKNTKSARMEGEGEYYVNEVDGLPNEHPALPSSYQDDEQNNSEVNRDSFDDLPTSLIVTSIHSEVFVNDELKAEMEGLFRQFSEDVTFQWLKSFRRLRVNYVDAVSAGKKNVKLIGFQIYKRFHFKPTLEYNCIS